MRLVGMRGIAAIATAFIFSCCATFQVKAQEAQDASVTPALAALGVWSASKTYAKDDIVSSRGSAWISLKAGNKNNVPGQTSPSSATWWRLFARGLNPVGAWSPSKKYQPDDLVTSLGATYRAKLTSQNKVPIDTSFWELLASKGDFGPTGAQGPAGPQGPTGPQGPAGPNSGISAGTKDAPAISFSGSSGTGIYSPSAGKIALVENGFLFLHNFTGSGTSTALGFQALESSSNSAMHNTAMGYAALSANDTGQFNTADRKSTRLNSSHIL